MYRVDVVRWENRYNVVLRRKTTFYPVYLTERTYRRVGKTLAQAIVRKVQADHRDVVVNWVE